MIIQHNMPAININRFFGMNQKLICKNAEKLSSGYRINRAGDDAAGLSISEKMRNQIRGLNQATKNIEDGISLIQTAEGALNETHSILARMRELAVQAANDTNDTSDRAMIQAEVDELVKEIDRIAYNTEFNSGIKPLLGAGGADLSKYFKNHTITFTATKQITVDGIAYNPGDKVTASPGVITNYVSNGKLLQVFLGNNWFPTSGEAIDLDEIDKKFIDIIERNGWGWSLRAEDFKVDENGGVYYSLKIGAISPSVTQEYVRLYYDAVLHSITAWGTKDKDDPKIMRVNSSNGVLSNLWIQSGANAGEGINLSLVDATATAIGVKGISVMSNAEAGNAIRAVDAAVKKVSEYRSAFGAQQNRLERAMTANLHYAENLQGAESKLRDTEMAGEMVEYSKQNILLQVGQALLAQANHGPQVVLNLL